MAVSSDLGDSLDVHPKHKQPVGERLAHWALNQTYGKKNVTPSGPMFRNVEFRDGAAYVSFDCAEGMHASDGKPLQTFEVAETEDIYITRNGKVVAKLSNPYQDRVDVAKSLFGVLSNDMTLEEAREERLNTI